MGLSGCAVLRHALSHVPERREQGQNLVNREMQTLRFIS